MSLLSSLISALSGNAVGNLFLLFTAIIGVGGSLWLQERRRSIRRNKLRRALLAEILSMQPMIRDLDYQRTASHPENELTEHPELFLSNNVYDSNTENIGDLTADEVTAIVDFYSAASKAQGVANRRPGDVFTEVSDRAVYAKLLEALSELSDNVDDFGPDIDEFEEPTETVDVDDVQPI